jgi:hypothetical protein
MATLWDLIKDQPWYLEAREKEGPLTYGFNRTDINAFFGNRFSDRELDAIQRIAAGVSNVGDAGFVKAWTGETFATPATLGGKNLWEEVQNGLTHMSQHPKGSRQGGTFGMFTGGFHKGDGDLVEVPEQFASGKKRIEAQSLVQQSRSFGRFGRGVNFINSPAIGLLDSATVGRSSLGGKSLLG